MDFHGTPSHAPVRDVDRPSAGAAYASSDTDARIPDTDARIPDVDARIPDTDARIPDVDARIPDPTTPERMAARAREDQALESLEAEITELWGHINAATARFLTLLAEFDRREGWAQHGLSSCAQWLNWQCGISRVAAREKVRTARALESLPKISAAFGEGRLSYSKVRALTRVATAETEDLLLDIALNGTAAHVERTVRGFRRVQRYRERDEAEVLHERRYLSCRRDADGSVRLDARLAPEVGEMLFKALQAADAQLEERGGDAESAGADAESAPTDAANADAESAVAEDVSAETPPSPFTLPPRPDAVSPGVSAETSPAGFVLPPLPDAVPSGVSAETPSRSVSQRRADALEHILGRFLAGKGSGSAGGAHELVVHIAHDALRDVPESSGASFENGGSVAVETARRLGCDGALLGVVEGDKGEPLAVGRRTRAVPPAIRRALRVRDGGCRFPGCDRSRFTHAHHIKHWADGGETRLDNLVTLCSQHHRLVHEGGYGVCVKEGEIRFARPDGREIPPAGSPPEGIPHGGCFRGNTSAASGDTCAAADTQPTGGAQRLAAANAARGVSIDARTARCRWGGERMDYDIAIDALCREAGYP